MEREKTTTLNTIAGTLPVRSGRILFGDEDITLVAVTGASEAPHSALVPEGRQLWPGMPVEENLLMWIVTFPVCASAPIATWRGCMSCFPGSGKGGISLPAHFPEASKQMCAIGRSVWMSEPQLLLLDEPTLGLAPILVDETFALIQKIAGRV